MACNNPYGDGSGENYYDNSDGCGVASQEDLKDFVKKDEVQKHDGVVPFADDTKDKDAIYIKDDGSLWVWDGSNYIPSSSSQGKTTHIFRDNKYENIKPTSGELGYTAKKNDIAVILLGRNDYYTGEEKYKFDGSNWVRFGVKRKKPQVKTVQVINSAYTLNSQIDDNVFIFTSSSNILSFFLPQVNSMKDRKLYFKIKTLGINGKVIIKCSGSETINTTMNEYELTKDSDYVVLVSDGLHWWIVSETVPERIPNIYNMCNPTGNDKMKGTLYVHPNKSDKNKHINPSCFPVIDDIITENEITPRVTGAGIDGRSIMCTDRATTRLENIGIGVVNSSFYISFWAYFRETANRSLYFIGNNRGTVTRKSIHIGFRNATTFTVAFYADDVNINLDKGEYANRWNHYQIAHNASTRKTTVVFNGSSKAEKTHSGNYQSYINCFGSSFAGKSDVLLSHIRILRHDDQGAGFTIDNNTFKNIYKSELEHLKTANISSGDWERLKEKVVDTTNAPIPSSDNHIPKFDGNAGKLQNTLWNIQDNNRMGYNENNPKANIHITQKGASIILEDVIKAGFINEVRGQLLDYGINYKQLLGNGYDNKYTGAWFRIDIRDAYKRKELFGIFKQEKNGDQSRVFGVGSEGETNINGLDTSIKFNNSIEIQPRIEPRSLNGLTPFENGWLNYDGGKWLPRISKTSNGMVSITGLVKGGHNNSRVCIIPTPYKPKNQLLFIAMCQYSKYQRIDIDIDGSLRVRDEGTRNGTGWITLQVTYWAGIH